MRHSLSTDPISAALYTAGSAPDLRPKGYKRRYSPCRACPVGRTVPLASTLTQIGSSNFPHPPPHQNSLQCSRYPNELSDVHAPCLGLWRLRQPPAGQQCGFSQCLSSPRGLSSTCAELLNLGLPTKTHATLLRGEAQRVVSLTSPDSSEHIAVCFVGYTELSSGL